MAGADVLISLLDITSLLLLLWVVQCYVQPGLSLSVFLLPRSFLPANPLLSLSFILLLFCLKNTAAYLLVKAQHHLSAEVAIRISENNLVRYQQASYSAYVQIDSSEHIRKIAFQPIEFCQHVLSGFQQMTTQLSLIVVTTAGIVLLNPKLFFLLMIILLPPAAFSFYLVKRRLEKAKAKVRSSNETSYRYLFDALKGYIEGNLFHRNHFFLQRFLKARREFSRHLFGSFSLQTLPGRMIEVFAVAGLFVLVLIAHWTGNQQDNSLLTIGAFMTAAYKIIPGLVKLINVSGQLKAFEFPDEDFVQQRSKINNGQLDKGIQSINIRELNFNYQQQPVVRNFSLSLHSGDFVGIRGKSGKGKTTVLNMLLGFLSPQSGEIFLNDNPTDQESRKAYWSAIAYVRQQTFLIHDTILRNITLEENAYDQVRLAYAIEESGMNEILKQFPEGLEKMVTENGKNISGGQQQRIALARALYKNADLILLDEPFNELDEESENSLLKHFQQLANRGKIIVMITHNPNSLRYCSKTVSLDEN